jgi:hypothetical protein
VRNKLTHIVKGVATFWQGGWKSHKSMHSVWVSTVLHQATRLLDFCAKCNAFVMQHIALRSD